MDLTLTLSARGFRGVYEAGALDFLLFALDAAAASGVRVRLSRLLCAHTGCVTSVLATSSLTAAHLPLPAAFGSASRLPGPNSLYHAWVDLPLPHNWATRALHEALSAALAHVPHVVLASAGPPVRRLPPFARALVVALSRGALSDAPSELTAGLEGAMARGRSAAGASRTRSRLSYGRPKPRDASFLVVDDARERAGARAPNAPALAVYASSLRVEQSWARFRHLAVNAATAPEILAAVLAACSPGLGDFLSHDNLFRSVARENDAWREKLLAGTPRLAGGAASGGPPPPRMRWPTAGSFGLASSSEMTVSSDMPGDSCFGPLSEEDEEEEDSDDEPPEKWVNVVLHIETADEAEGDKPEGGPSEQPPRPQHSERAYSSLSASTDSSSSSSEEQDSAPLELTFTLRPTSAEGARAPDCLATSTLGPMGAALVKSVRQHDFLLGRHNMQNFLLEKLVHPETGESLLPLCGLAAKPIPPPEWPVLEPAQEKRVQRQSRRIWEKFLAEWHSAMRQTNLAPQGLTLANLKNAPNASVGFKSSLDRLSRSFLARFFYTLTSGIRRAKARRAQEAEEGGGGQLLEEG